MSVSSNSDSYYAIDTDGPVTHALTLLCPPHGLHDPDIVNVRDVPRRIVGGWL